MPDRPSSPSIDRVDPLRRIALVVGLPADAALEAVLARVQAMDAALKDPQVVGALEARDRLRARAAAFELALAAGVEVRLAAKVLRDGLAAARSPRERAALEHALTKLRPAIDDVTIAARAATSIGRGAR